ncbi:unnamed protein product [Pocillopora meandrina]|uniref:VWFA domain-containing protein n=1 Tax=Pocillopora meandrina TaxID=46732 RepID=A0AAU9WPS4_9CNID|nr:unnamed protein product [Pocillopora meandrina]
MLDCEDPPLDICLVIDQTQSVGVENYKTMLKAVINFVGFFNVGIKDTRIAIVSFASDAKKRIGFSDSAYQSLEKLTEYLTSMFNDTLGRPTRTDRALEKAIQVLKEGDANHQGVLMVLTDGKTNPKSRDLGEVMKELSVSAIGIHRIAVGVGRRRLNITQLKQIAGEHNDDGVILMENFEDLHHKIRKLREVTCSINGGFSEWSSWSECSASCGGGVHGRERTCTSPPPRHAGKDCKGESFETRTCNNEECAEPGGYTDWSAWGECSVTCGGGFQSRKRSCTNPPASHGGLNCKAQKLGPAEEERACNNKQDCSECDQT